MIYSILTLQTLNSYIKAFPHSFLHRYLGEGMAYTVTDLSDGNLNLVFRVQNTHTLKRVIVKQALPFSRRFPEFKVSKD
jgi:5-methylthioribose kinase